MDWPLIAPSNNQQQPDSSNNNINGNSNNNSNNNNNNDTQQNIANGVQVQQAAQQAAAAAFLDPLHTHAIMAAGNLGQNQAASDLVSIPVPVVVSNNNNNNNNNNNHNLSNNTSVVPPQQQNNIQWLPQLVIQQASTPQQHQHNQHQLQPQPLQQEQQQPQHQQQPIQIQTFFPLQHQPQQTQQQQQQKPPLPINSDIMQSRVATIVSGPNGQQMILNPTAAASLFDTQNKSAQSIKQPQPQPQPQSQQQHGNLQQPNIFTIQPQQQQQLTNVVVYPPQKADEGVQQQQQHQQQFPIVTESGGRKRSSNEIGLGQDGTKRQCNEQMNQINHMNQPLLQQQHQQQLQQEPEQQMLTTTKLSKSSKAMNNKNMTPEERRRHERNLREQQRSHKISQQIKELRSVLAESKVPFKPNKFSILMSVAEYIKQLQNRSTFLDEEMNKLLNTIRQSSELVNSGLTPNNHRGDGGDMHIRNDAEMLFVQGLDFKAIFEQASTAFGVASLDGRFLRCNSKFERVSGYSKEELEKQNLFNLLERTEIEKAYRALGKFLKQPDVEVQSESEKTDVENCGKNERGECKANPGFWSGKLMQPNLQMNITLTRTSDGAPKFLNCALSAIDSQMVFVKSETT